MTETCRVSWQNKSFGYLMLLVGCLYEDDESGLFCSFAVLATSVHSVHFLKTRTYLLGLKDIHGNLKLVWASKYLMSINRCSWIMTNVESIVFQQAKRQQFHTICHVLDMILKGTSERSGIPLDSALKYLICSICYNLQIVSTVYLDSQALPIKHCKM
jgi:hypothetical protein